MITAVWILTFVALALWSLTAWGLHALLTLDPGQVGVWAGDLGRMAAEVPEPYRGWLEQWVPGWEPLMQLALQFTQTALGWVGAAAPVIVGAVWGLGALLTLGVALGLTLLVRALRPRQAPVPA